MAWCLTAPSHYLIQCWCVTSKVPWHSSEGIIMRKDLKIPISETRLKISLLRWHADPPGASELMIGCQVSRLINGHQSGMLYSIIIIWPYEKKRVTYSSIDCDLAEEDWIIYSVKTSVILTYIAANHDDVICIVFTISQIVELKIPWHWDNSSLWHVIGKFLFEFGHDWWYSGLILGLHPANERQHYLVMMSLFGWVHASLESALILVMHHLSWA